MHRSIRLLYLGVGLVALGCSAEPGQDDSAPANPVERRVEPVRQRAEEADSLMRARAQEVQDLAQPEG